MDNHILSYRLSEIAADPKKITPIERAHLDECLLCIKRQVKIMYEMIRDLQAKVGKKS